MDCFYKHDKVENKYWKVNTVSGNRGSMLTMNIHTISSPPIYTKKHDGQFSHFANIFKFLQIVDKCDIIFTFRVPDISLIM